MKNSLKRYINGRSCAILGLGVSNLPLAERISAEGLALTVYDKVEQTSLDSRAEALWRSGAEYVRTDSFRGIKGELVFRSPGIRPDRISAEQGAELTSEMELFLKLTEATAFGITGSDGKTTSTTLTGLFLAEENKRAGKGQTFFGFADLVHQTAAAEVKSFHFQILSLILLNLLCHKKLKTDITVRLIFPHIIYYAENSV